MLDSAVYFLLAVGATTVGALTGMGGGIIIKPVMDVMGRYDASTIGAVTAITVLAMSVVSVGRHVMAKTRLPGRMAVILGLGSVAGGALGQKMLVALTAGYPNRQVVVVQNVALGLLILGVVLYMANKGRLRSLGWSAPAPSLAAGVFLGVCAAFLGIGGGPINVALLIFLFSLHTKTATACSLVTILVAQISKLASLALTSGFAGLDLSVAPVMAAGAVAGGFIGAALNKKISEKAVERSFDAVQLLVLAMCVFNVARNLR